MENKVIYVPVSVQEELPEQHEFVHLIMANGANLIGVLNSDSEWAIRYLDSVGHNSPENPVTHWLKRIELPSEEEIKATLLPKAHEFFAHGFIDGANHILSIINQNK